MQIRCYWLLMAVAVPASPAFADNFLYKCVAGNGAVSIQSDPCPSGSHEAWKRDTAAMAAAAATMPLPAAPPTPSPPPPPPGERGLSRASVESLAPISATEPGTPPPDPCEQAQDLAAELRDMPWLELTSDQQQRLTGWLMQQCRPAAPEQR